MVLAIFWTENDSKNNRGYCLFDIEYYLKQSEVVPNKWFSEISVHAVVEGLSKFVYHNSNNPNFNIDEFIKDGEGLTELRRWLYEIEGNKNSELHYTTRYDYIRNVVDKFAEKYGCYVNID